MIIFGGKTTPKVLGASHCHCKTCHRKTVHGLVQVKEWFTLYFIPVIPLSNRLFVICERCGVKQHIEGEAKNLLIQKAQQID